MSMRPNITKWPRSKQQTVRKYVDATQYNGGRVMAPNPQYQTLLYQDQIRSSYATSSQNIYFRSLNV